MRFSPFPPRGGRAGDGEQRQTHDFSNGLSVAALLCCAPCVGEGFETLPYVIMPVFTGASGAARPRDRLPKFPKLRKSVWVSSPPGLNRLQ